MAADGSGQVKALHRKIPAVASAAVRPTLEADLESWTEPTRSAWAADRPMVAGELDRDQPSEVGHPTLEDVLGQVAVHPAPAGVRHALATSAAVVAAVAGLTNH